MSNLGNGYLALNKYKEAGDKKPDMKGKLTIGDKKYDVAGWNETKDDGSVLMKLKLSEPYVKEEAAPTQNKATPFKTNDDEPFNDSIPF